MFLDTLQLVKYSRKLANFAQISATLPAPLFEQIVYKVLTNQATHPQGEMEWK